MLIVALFFLAIFGLFFVVVLRFLVLVYYEIKRGLVVLNWKLEIPEQVLSMLYQLKNEAVGYTPEKIYFLHYGKE